MTQSSKPAACYPSPSEIADHITHLKIMAGPDFALAIKPFQHLPEYNVIVCGDEGCGFAVLANEVPTHLRKRHGHIAATRRRQIALAAAQIPGVKRTQADLAGFQFPPPTARRIIGLAGPVSDGLGCRRCTKVYRHVQKMQAHCRDEHGWTNTRGPGRPNLKRKHDQAEPEGLFSSLPWRENVCCQRFFPSRYASEWFEVEYKQLDDLPTLYLTQPRRHQRVPHKQSRDILCNQVTQKHVDAVLERHASFTTLQNEPWTHCQNTEQPSMAGTSPWLDRTQWHITYRDCRRDVLATMARLPFKMPKTTKYNALRLDQYACDGGADFLSQPAVEYRVAMILQAMTFVIARCEETVVNTNRGVRSWLLSSSQGKCPQKTFTVMTEESTKKRYSTVWRKFLAFVLRLYHLVPEASNYVGTHLPANIRQVVQRLWEHRIWSMLEPDCIVWPTPSDGRYSQTAEATTCEEAIGDEDGDILVCEDGYCPDIEDGDVSVCSEVESLLDADEADEGQSDELEQNEVRLLAVSNESARQQDEYGVNNHSQGKVTQGFTVLETANTEFLELLFDLNKLLCEQEPASNKANSTLLLYFCGILGFTADFQGFKLARDYCPNLSGMIYIQRILFLESVLPQFGYQTLGLAERPTQGQLGLIHSFCAKYTVVGSNSTLVELLSLRAFGYLTAKTEAPSTLLYWSEDGKSVSYGDLTVSMDDIGKLSMYFITTAEDCCRDLLYGLQPNVSMNCLKDDLVNREIGYSFIQHPDNGLESVYKDLLIRACHDHGRLPCLMSTNNKQWSLRALDTFLDRTSVLLQMICGAMYATGGQVPRLRGELLEVAYENSVYKERGMYVWNGSVFYLIKHHKAKRITNKEFYVARFLPARFGKVVIQYMAYIRPVAAILRRERDIRLGKTPAAVDSKLLFQKDGKRWPSSRVTTILRKAGQSIWHQKLNAQVYRQIAIGITEKHVREVHKPFNQYNDRGPDADQNVAFAWQSGHRPMQRGITYGLDGAYPHRLQPALLRLYEWASTRWHEFLGLQSKLTEELQPHSTAAAVKPKASIAYSKGRTEKGRVEFLNLPISQAVTILRPHKLAVCMQCKLAIYPGPGIEAHFRRKHCVVDEDMRTLKSSYSHLKLNSPDTVPLPEDHGKPIPELHVYCGWECHICKYISRAKQVLQNHFKEIHNGEKVTTRNSVSVQSFTYTKPRYWKVE